MEEIWADVKGYEGLYQVSNIGNVRSLPRTVKQMNNGTLAVHHYEGRQRVLNRLPNGYLQVTLWKDGQVEYFQVHRLVAAHFIPNPENKPEVDHINAIRHDNRLENLRWVTHSENQNNPISRQKMSDGLKGKPITEEHRRSLRESHLGKKLPEEQKRKIGEAQTGEKHWRATPVEQYDLNGNLIHVFRFIGEAIEETSIQNISACCRGLRRSAGGFIWKYAQ